MDKIILNAKERDAKSKIVRNSGYIPGILYGDGIEEASSVEFEESALKKVLSRHGSHAKLWVDYGPKKKFGFIKDVQKHPVSNNILHIDIQIVSQDHDVKIQIPINFDGEEALTRNELHLQIHKSMADIVGKATKMPGTLHVDVSQKIQGDTITFADFNLDKGITVANEEEIYGTIGHLRTVQAETPTEESLESVEGQETETQPTDSE